MLASFGVIIGTASLDFSAFLRFGALEALGIWELVKVGHQMGRKVLVWRSWHLWTWGISQLSAGEALSTLEWVVVVVVMLGTGAQELVTAVVVAALELVTLGAGAQELVTVVVVVALGLVAQELVTAMVVVALELVTLGTGAQELVMVAVAALEFVAVGALRAAQ